MIKRMSLENIFQKYSFTISLITIHSVLVLLLLIATILAKEPWIILIGFIDSPTFFLLNSILEKLFGKWGSLLDMTMQLLISGGIQWFAIGFIIDFIKNVMHVMGIRKNQNK